MVNKETFLHMSEKTLSMIVEQLPNPVIAVNGQNKVIYANRLACNQLHFSVTEEMKERGGMFYGSNWLYVEQLSRDEERALTISRTEIDGKGYLCFQSDVPEDDIHDAFSILSLQEEEWTHDLYFDCRELTEAVLQSNEENEGSVIANSKRMQPVLQSCLRCAKSDMTVLLLGESGTGKTMLAEYIHQHSSRRNGPFIVLNCAAIAPDLLESELFGYAPYAFTNANAKGKLGLFEMADKGTLLFDEIGDMPLDLQVKILNTMDTQSFLAVGGREYKSVDVRILAATNKNLKEMAKQGDFRQDLLWRLNAMEIKVPALRERREDILYIANYFRYTYNEMNGTDKRFTPALRQFMYQYDWPGNVRQLKNVVEKMLFMSREAEIPLSAARNLFSEDDTTEKESLSFADRMEERERRYIQWLYQKYPSSRKLAGVLDVSQSTANRLIKKYIHTTDQMPQDAVGEAQAVLPEPVTQYHLFHMLYSIPQRICVVDQDLFCIAKKERTEKEGVLQDNNPSSGSPTTAMYRAGYKLVRLQNRPILLEYVTVAGKRRHTVMAPIANEMGEPIFYTSISQVRFCAKAARKRIEERKQLKQMQVGAKSFAFYGASANMNLFLQDANRAAWQDLSVLIRGESGTGKSVFARYIHEFGGRKKGPFVSINCASIPHNLIESELFGYEGGAFTGADPNGRKGLFEMANHGTLFLDEIGDMPLSAQAKLLDVIENKRFIPIGGKEVVTVDVRIVCATNRDLKQLIAEKRFREDLYWRINVIELCVPALRLRMEDIEHYALFFLEQCVKKYGDVKRLAPEVLCLFVLYDWPGNLRQLSNAVERGYVMSEDSVIHMTDLPDDLVEHETTDPLQFMRYSEQQNRWTNEIFGEALEQYGSARGAASVLQVSHATISRKRASAERITK